MQIKTALVLTSFQLLIAMAALGQARFGFKVGATFSFPHAGKSSIPPPDPIGYSSYVEDVSGRGGVLLGVFVPIQLSTNFQLRPSADLGFRSMVPKVVTQYGGNVSSYEYRHGVSYLDFPVPLTYVISKKGYKWLMGAGPSVSILLNPSYQIVDFNKKVDFGVNGLLAYETNIGFSINLQYVYGVTNLAANQDFKNRFLNISVGYLF